VRAAVALRPILAELGMPSLPSVLSIPTIGSTLTTEGTSNEAWIDNAAERFLAEFEWYAEALAAKRKQGTPY
jgi:NAD(P)H-dependent FMN reductase